MSQPVPKRNLSHPLIRRNGVPNTFFSRLVFSLSRLADVPLQYQILRYGLGTPTIEALGGQVLLPYLPAATQQGAITSFLGLSPYRTVLLAMSVGSMLKQNYWVLRVSRDEMSPFQSIGVGLFNGFMNSLNSLVFLNTATSAISTPPEEWDLTSPRLLVGSALFVTGIALEWISEVQRKAFKDDPRNQGKVYMDGLFGMARHINYGGYMLWRAGAATAAGGWTFGAVIGLFNFFFFERSSIPELDEYCSLRYDRAWAEYKRRVPYKLLPYIW
ncbi:hypothetical protein E1B28_003725 [Marasmius oreades]|uniref:Steroid 5-alpha reductase C-terminal domain-containing protein n=1 Tax=Marasmius oreades TaxID=181124 RepID=A0A9P7UX60_9AGAR|nr:uncharacterized protein E1B28_003725 [Marasmius oreades]KAG7096277.1 hypothetical protein E1B28_003725 [Marasmius oreades]